MKRSWVMALIVGSSLMAQEPATPAPATTATPKVGELERLGDGGRDMMILGVEAPGFDKLRPSQRKFAYYLYRAAIAGDQISYYQNHRYAHEIKDLLEGVWAHKSEIDPDTAKGLEEYLKLVWANHGNYSHTHSTKFVPRLLTFDQLRKAAKVAAKKGEKFELNKGENLDKKLARLKPFIFDPKVEAVQVNEVAGTDAVATSSNGLYDPGLKAADIAALPAEAQQKLNVRFGRKKVHGKWVAEPQTFMVDGVYGQQLANVVFWLQKAEGYIENVHAQVTDAAGVTKDRFVPNPDQKKALDDLIAYFQSGDEATFKQHSISWLKSKSAVDYLNGFYEVYKDPRAVIGSYEASVNFRADSDKIEKLSASAAYFETKMPWKDEWKRAKIDPPVASVVNVVIETGDSGPMSPAAYNLPNYADIRKEYGSKNVVLSNIESAAGSVAKAQINQAFYRPEDQEAVTKFGDLGRQWLVYMHEVIGHGSGQADASLNGVDPAVKIGGVYSALEECRADSVALYQFADPKVEEIGAVSAADHELAVKAMFLKYLGGQLLANGLIKGDTIREAHFRGRQLVLNYLVQNQKGVQVDQIDGHYFVEVTDLAKAHAGMGEILIQLETFKSMGDKDGAEAFFAKYGTQVNADWQKDAAARLDALNLPHEKAFVFPKLTPVIEQKNERDVLKDVKIENSQSFEEQMLWFEKLGASRELDPK